MALETDSFAPEEEWSLRLKEGMAFETKGPVF